MRRLILTVVLLVVMAACCVPVYAAGGNALTISLGTDEGDPSVLDGEYVYNISGTTDASEPFDFDMTAVFSDGVVTSMTSTDESGFVKIMESFGGCMLVDLPDGNYLVRETARPGNAKIYDLRVNSSGESHINFEEGTAEFSINSISDPSPQISFLYRVRHLSPAISADADVLKPYAGMAGAQKLYYGGDRWTVIAHESVMGDGKPLVTGGDTMYPENSVTLLKSDVNSSDMTAFNKTYPPHDWSNCYGWLYDSSGSPIEPEAPSTLREFIDNRYTGEKGAFSKAEQEAIIPRTLEGGADNYSEGKENKIRGDSVDGAKLWPLSYLEAWNLRWEVLRASCSWWLRTPGDQGKKVQYISGDSYIASGDDVNKPDSCARPAFNLDEDKVILISAAAGGKKSGEEGPDALTEVETKENTDWKVTLKDEKLKDFKIDSVKTCNGENLFIEYSGAVLSTIVSDRRGSYISAVIKNGNDVKYYGRIKALKADEDKAGGVLINLKGKLDKTAGDKVFVFNELFNGDRQYKEDGQSIKYEECNDYVSDLIEVDIPSESEYEHDYKDATCTEPKTCVRCGATDGKPSHSFTKYESNNNATCTKDGTKTAKCDRCDATDTVTDEGSALGHSFTKYESNNNATCTKDATKTAKCDRCDATDTQPDTGSALGHSFTKYESNNDATCTKDGTKTAKCDRCDATDTVTDEKTALGHSFTKYVSNDDATITKDGTKTAKCDRCDATDTVTDEGSALGRYWQTEPMDLKAESSASGNGWTWDGESRTLTISGMIMDLTESQEDFDAAITLPDGGATIIVNDKESNITVPGGKTKSGGTENRLAVESKGDLKILGDGAGTLEIQATGGANGISADGSITIGDPDTLKGPTVEVYGTSSGIISRKTISVYGSTLEAGNTVNDESSTGAVIAVNFGREQNGITIDHSDLTLSAAGNGAAGLGAVYGDIYIVDSSISQTPVEGAEDVDGIITMNGSVFIKNSQAYFDLGSGDKVGGSVIAAEFGDQTLQTNRDIYITDSVVRGMDSDSGLYAFYGGAEIKNSTVDLTATSYTVDCNFKGLKVEDSNVDLNSTGAYFAACGRIGGPFTIKNSTFTAVATGEMSSGLSVNYPGKTVFSGKDTKISLEGTYSAIDFNSRKSKKDYPLTMKNNLAAKEGGELQPVFDKSDKTYTWSYSPEHLTVDRNGLLTNASKKVEFAAGKANTIKVKGKTYKVDAKKLKKKSVTVKRAKVLTVKKAKGDLIYTKKKGNKKITINYKTGKVKLKKGLKKGKYKVTATVFAAGNSKYGQATKKRTFKIVVK